MMVVDDNFYYNSGLLFARKFGNKPMAFKQNCINNYKRFIDEMGGPSKFKYVEEAFEKFLITKRRSYVKR